MSSKQDEKNQKILRDMMMRPENRKCMDCSAKGTVAVVIDYGTFVCQACSGIQFDTCHVMSKKCVD